MNKLKIPSIEKTTTLPPDGLTKAASNSDLSQLACYAPPRDKHGREIRVGDTLKVFHFQGARRKRFYMYKFVERIEQRRTWTRPMLAISHLGREQGFYYEAMNGKKLEDYEIVQGFGPDGRPFDERPKAHNAEPEESL